MARQNLWKPLGRYIRSRREELNLTQIAVCKKIGFSCQFYGKIERGEVPCPEKALKKLVKLLGLQRTEVQEIFLFAAKEDALNLYTTLK